MQVAAGDLHQRRLAAAVAAQDDPALTVLDPQVDAVEDGDAVTDEPHVAEDERRPVTGRSGVGRCSVDHGQLAWLIHVACIAA